ncbi:taste receptor type 2 member 3 [Saccopteryx bilineata]|uniref:taste receptor type 2 member 3 n=1 Tax=Saccopteryx bilineata TaxID=59482 RepID=UPI00338E0EDC
MSELTRAAILFLSVTQFILGLLGNAFIGWVNGSRWFKSKKISVSDFVITSLALSRITLLWILLVDCLVRGYLRSIYASDIAIQLIDTLWTFTNSLSIWLATCLSVFYCLKIASFSHHVFLWLKWRVHRVVVWLLLSALVLSCGSVLSLMREFKAYYVLRGLSAENMTEHFRKQEVAYELVHVLGLLWDLPPLIVSLASYVLLILSLGRHTRRMQQHGASSSDPSTEAHKKAIKMILSFLFLFLIYFLSFLIASSSYFIPGTELTKMVMVAVTMFYPAGHSFVLILGNNKLKQTFVELLWCEPARLTPVSRRRLSP